MAPFDGNPEQYVTTEPVTEPDVFSLEGLAAWLETMPAEKEYPYNDCKGGCLLGQYLTYRGLDFLSIGGTYWRDNSHRQHDLPWALNKVAVVAPHNFGAALARTRALLVSPNYDEIMQAAGLRSRSGAHRLVNGLADCGYIAFRRHRARSILVL